MQVNGEFQPTIVAFCCNWCSYAGADLSGTNRLQYPANVKIIRIPCSCRLNPLFILRAFQRGADGVILCGCHPGDCHYTTGNYYARRRMMQLYPEIYSCVGCNACTKACPQGLNVMIWKKDADCTPLERAFLEFAQEASGIG